MFVFSGRLEPARREGGRGRCGSNRYGRRLLSFFALALAGSCASLPPTLAQDAPAAPRALRLCADPANLPFFEKRPAKPGIYNEIGEAIGRALGRPVTYVWYRTYFGARAVRATMLAKQCEAMIGLPNSDAFMGPKGHLLEAAVQSRLYAIVAPKGQSFANVEDLKGKRVAVQFETEPQNIVGPRGRYGPPSPCYSAEEGMKALAEGRADAAFLWAPTAGLYFQPDRLRQPLLDRRGRRPAPHPGRPRLATPRRPRACATRSTPCSRKS